MKLHALIIKDNSNWKKRNCYEYKYKYLTIFQGERKQNKFLLVTITQG